MEFEKGREGGEAREGGLSLSKGPKVVGPSERPLGEIKKGSRDKVTQGDGKRPQRRRAETPKIERGKNRGQRKSPRAGETQP